MVPLAMQPAITAARWPFGPGDSVFPFGATGVAGADGQGAFSIADLDQCPQQRGRLVCSCGQLVPAPVPVDHMQPGGEVQLPDPDPPGSEPAWLAESGEGRLG